MSGLSRSLRSSYGRVITVCLMVSIGANVFMLFKGINLTVSTDARTGGYRFNERDVSFLENNNARFLNLTLTQLQNSNYEPDESRVNIPPPDDTYCSLRSRWNEGIITPESPTDLTNWAFNTRVKCPNFSLTKYPKEREKISLKCDSNPPEMVSSLTNSSSDVEQVKFGDECLVGVIDNCCKDDKHVPNVVHYIWYAEKELEYFQFISFMSVLRFMKPCLILIHGNFLPYGQYWDYFISSSPNVIHVMRDRPTVIFGHKLAFKEHASDIMRIEALTTYGGVYVDFDEILLRPLEPLRQYEYTQGLELEHTLGSQLVMAKKNATFLYHWHLSYKDNYKKSWAWNALWVPRNISKKYPELIHVEGYNFTRPNWKNVDQIFKKNYDWSTNYGIHLYVRWYKNETNNDVIRRLNTTIGAVCRHVLFGNKELCMEE